MQAVYNTITDEIAGYTDDPAFIPAPGSVCLDLPEDWDESDRDNAIMIDGQLVVDLAAKLAKVKADRKAKIKREAASLIEATDWRVTRAQERQVLGVEGETVAEVLAEREAMRRASNRAKAEVNALASPASVRAYTWAVTEADQIEQEEY